MSLKYVGPVIPLKRITTVCPTYVFNETFAECRERKGQRTNGHQIDPDLTNEKEETNDEKYPEKESSDEDAC